MIGEGKISMTKKTRKYFENKILETLQEAHNSGYTIAVASDEEGNNFNRINPTSGLFYKDSKKKTLVLSVWNHIEEEEIFEDNQQEGVYEANEQEQKMLKAHMAEINAKGAEATNFGWATGEDFIHSKTTNGKLFTEIINGKIKHEWTK